MKAVVLLDDLDLSEGQRRIASTPVRLGWDGEWYDLDLSDEHAQDLWNGIQPYLKAGRQVQHSGPREGKSLKEIEADPSVPRYGRVALYHAAGMTSRAYWTGFRAWAASNGYTIKQYKDRTYQHPVALVEKYERHLSSLDRQRAAREAEAG